MGSFLNKIYGSKVKVPKFEEIDYDAVIEKAFKSIQDQLPKAQRVVKSIAKADADTTLEVLEKFAPGSRDAIKQQVNVLQAGLRGELPAEVQDQIINRGAAQAQFGGFAGSGAARKLVARDLGLTRLQRIDTAMSQSAQTFNTIRGFMPRTPSVSSMFLSPQQKINFERSDRTARFNRNLQAAQVKAQPDPVWGGMYQGAMQLAGAVLGSGGSVLGMGGGGGNVNPNLQQYTGTYQTNNPGQAWV